MDIAYWLRHVWPKTGIELRYLGRHPVSRRRRAHGARGRGRVDYHLTLQVTGRSEFIHPTGRYELDPGAMLLLPTGSTCAERALGPGSEHLVADFMVVSPGETDPLTVFDLPVTCRPRRIPWGGNIVRRWLEPMVAVHAPERVLLAARRDAQVLLDAFVLEAVASVPEGDLVEAGLPAWMRQALRFLRQRFPRQGMRVADIAREAGVAESTLSRGFVAHTGKTPWAFITDLRLEEAARIARAEPSVPWSEVAERCGFGDYRHFARLFKRRYGVTPQAWR